MPSEPTIPKNPYDFLTGLEDLYGFGLSTFAPSTGSQSQPSVTVNVEAGTLVMQDELVSLINDAVIAANKNGYIQLPNGAIVG